MNLVSIGSVRGLGKKKAIGHAWEMEDISIFTVIPDHAKQERDEERS